MVSVASAGTRANQANKPTSKLGIVAVKSKPDTADSPIPAQKRFLRTAASSTRKLIARFSYRSVKINAGISSK